MKKRITETLLCALIGAAVAIAIYVLPEIGSWLASK